MCTYKYITYIYLFKYNLKINTYVHIIYIYDAWTFWKIFTPVCGRGPTYSCIAHPQKDIHSASICHSTWWVGFLALPTASPQKLLAPERANELESVPHEDLQISSPWVYTCVKFIEKPWRYEVWKETCWKHGRCCASSKTRVTLRQVLYRLGCTSLTVMVHLFEMCLRRADVMLSIGRLRQSRFISLVWLAWNHFNSYCMYRHVEAMWHIRLHTLLDAILLTHVLPKEVLDTRACHLPRYIQQFPFLQACSKKMRQNLSVHLCNPACQQKIEPSKFLKMEILFGYTTLHMYECVQVRSGYIVHLELNWNRSVNSHKSM